MQDAPDNPKELPASTAPALDYARLAPRRSATVANLALVSAGLCYPGCAVELHFVLAPLALVLGVIAIRRARRMPDRFAGKRRAIAAISIASAALPLWFWVVTARHAVYGPWGGVIRSDCDWGLRGVGIALGAYAADRGGAFPPDLTALLPTYLECAEDLRARHAFTNNTVCDWNYVSGLDVSAPPRWIIAYGDPKWFNNEGGPILFVDGTVQLSDRQAFDHRITQFLADYERARGSSPSILPAR
jgi:hypothetical protein